MANRPFPFSLTSLAAAIAGALLSSAASGQTTLSCPVQGNNNVSCTFTGTNYSETVTIQAPAASDVSRGAMYVTTNFIVNATIASDTQAGLLIQAIAANGSSSEPYDGSDAVNLTPNTSGSITLSGGAMTTSGPVYGLLAQMRGGNAATSSDGETGGSGGVSGTENIVYLANQASVDMTGLSQTVIQGGAGVAATSQGGNGSGTSGDHNPSGAGGQSAGARLKNQGNVTVTAQGGKRFAGLQATSNGGNGGNQYDGGSNSGGGAGVVSLQNSGQVIVDWTWADVDTSSSNAALYGILAQAQGGNGGESTEDGLGNGGAGGSADSALITLETGGSVSVTQHGTPPATIANGGKVILPGAGVAAVLLGGNGGNGMADEDGTLGGNGGDAGSIGSSAQSSTASVQINNTDTSVTTSGDQLAALRMVARGGAGGGQFNQDSYSERNGGSGGKAGDGYLSITASTATVSLSTDGSHASGIQTLQLGGTGGAGADYNDDLFGIGTDPAGNGGSGGQVGGLTLDLNGTKDLPISISTAGEHSHGIYAVLQGGQAGDGGTQYGTIGKGQGGNGGAGGSTGKLTLDLAGTTISTQGANAFGIIAQSRGEDGGAGGTSHSTKAVGANGGNGGSSGAVSVTLDANSSISTQGQNAVGILAQSTSGAGGDGGNANGEFGGHGGVGGAGGNAGAVNVTNHGSISTLGAEGVGILAQSLAGAGGTGASDYGIITSKGGTGGSAGTAGVVSVTHDGQITTGGDLGLGILAQSISGSGGAGGSAGGLVVAIGGSDSATTIRSDANSVNIYASPSGSISTTGVSAIGVLAQSVGGGGGTGGASNAAVSVGATGGEGGSGGFVYGNLSSFTVNTTGDNAYGFVAQSVGGGGGNAGNADSTSVFASVAIGQAAGSGGAGGGVTANLASSSITTQGTKAAGLVAQSIGGGGGTGGRAFGSSVGAGASGAVAIGGQGGTGGDGGAVSSEMIGGSIATGQVQQLIDGTCGNSPCLALNELPVDAFGAVVQSIGGGGGLGGNATANAAAIGVQVTEAGTQVSIAASVSLGGKGGAGGNGDYVTFATSQGATISTQGQGAHGVLIQSIGGGGGAGGDSSSLAASLLYGKTVPDGATALSIDSAFALGADGNSGGNGGSVWTAVGGLINVSDGNAQFSADPAGTATSSITTYGDYANGVTAQSIGGGGGNAGFGSANTQAFGSGTNFSPSVALGGTGGSGGAGGLVQVQVMPTGTVQTWGSGAIGVLAQSIGGGGGASQGGSFTLLAAGSFIGSGTTLNLGNQGSEGGTGGTVEVDVSGSITTAGADAPGVQAQSIGGGGGQGGAAGSDASFDNPILAALDARAAGTNVAKALYALLNNGTPSGQFHFTRTMSLGGAGGPGNVGGTVDVTLEKTGKIVTAGDWSSGIFAQSVGGGGGKGGSAFATGTGWVDPTHFNLNTNVALGGAGGAGADGGGVTANLNGGSVSTSGFGAAGILAQSVGGGGGHGADGSDGFVGTLSLGGAAGGGAGGGGEGGDVTLNTASSPTTLSTKGEAAFGVMLQSVGGGGGLAGAGTSVRVAVADDPIPPIKIAAGTDAGKISASESMGRGGNVTLQDLGGMSISTHGNNAVGVLAQSVGGAGGTIINSQNQLASTGVTTTIVGSTVYQGAAFNFGGDVTVNLAEATYVTTSGTGAHGVLAQSVGGGGGIVGLPGTSASLTVDPSKAGTMMGGSGVGGNVTVSTEGTISVAGTGAVGILAQSVSGAGGLMLSPDGNSVYAGSAGGNGVDNVSSMVTVSVGQDGIVSATGANSYGIFAQNAGGAGGVQITIDGMVTGGQQSSSPGAAVWVDSSPYGAANLTINTDGWVEGHGGTAILATGGALSVDNNGTVHGSSKLNNGSMTNAGTYAMGAEFEGALYNSGLLALGGREGLLDGTLRTRYAATTLMGSLTQAASGILQAGADFDAMASDSLVVNGVANLDGGLRIAPRALMPDRELAILTVNGVQTGALTAIDSPIFDYEARQAGSATHVRVAGADFNAASMGLPSNLAKVAGHLQNTWDQGGSSDLSRLYAALDVASRNGAGEYRDKVSDLSPGVALAPAAQMQFGMARFTTTMMSCPAFMETGALTQERNCFWGEVQARRTNQDGVGGTSGFSYDSETYQFGGQRQIAPHWYLGGSMAYQNTRLYGDDRRVSGSGGAGYAGIVLKREVDAWTFSGALGGGYGSYDLDRNLNIQGFDNKATSSPDVYSFGVRLRAARTFTQGNFYLKPYADLTAAYSRMPAYRESGDALRLKVERSDQFVFGLAPTLEAGGRVELPNGAVMRPFAYAGVSLLSEDGWKTRARLEGAQGSAGRFTTTMPTDNVIGRIGAGIQVMNAGSVDFRLQYDGEFASGGNSHSAALKLAVPF